MEQDILIEGYIEGLFLSEDVTFLEEGLKQFMDKLTPPKLKQYLSHTFEMASSKDLRGFLALSKKFGLDINKVKPRTVMDTAKEFPDEIQKGAVLASRVIKNSIPKASKSAVRSSGYFVAIMAKIKHPRTNYMGAVKAELKSYIGKVQQFYEEDSQDTESRSTMKEDAADIAIAIGTVVALSAITVISITAFYFLVKYALYMALVAIGVALLNWAFKER